MKHLSKMNIRSVFSLSFSCFVALPILVIFAIAAVLTLRNVRADSIDRIKVFHSSLITSLELEEKNVSARLSHLMYANSGAILSLSKDVDTDDATARYEGLNRLSEAMDYSLPPISEILSAKFVFESGRSAEYKSSLNMVVPKNFEESLLEDKGNVHTMAFNAGLYPSLYIGTTDDNLIWIAGIAPGPFLDRSGNVKYVLLYQISAVYRTLQSYDTSYALGRSSMGYTAILSEDGNVLSSARMNKSDIELYLEGKERSGYSYISTPFEGYQVLTIVKNTDLLNGYWYILQILLVAILVVFLSFLVFLNILLRSVINPVDKVSDGLRAVENGDLSLHIEASGVQEVRRAIHAFNAMVRRLRGLIADYEDRISDQENSPGRLFSLYIHGKAKDKELAYFEKN